MAKNDEHSWWFPTLCDDKYCDELREEYPDQKNDSNEELIDHFNDGRKYAVTWDHIGDAYSEFEKLADAYLELLDAHRASND